MFREVSNVGYSNLKTYRTDYQERCWETIPCRVDPLNDIDSSTKGFLSLVSIWIFFVFCCSFWFFVPTKSHNEQCDAQMETSAKSQNEQQKVFASFGF